MTTISLNGWAWDADRYPNATYPGPYCLREGGTVWQYTGPGGWVCRTSEELHATAVARARPFAVRPEDGLLDCSPQIRQRVRSAAAVIMDQWDTVETPGGQHDA